MELSAELLSQFTKVTNDDTKNTKKESFVYGTTVVHEGRKYVKLDGSEILTPVSSTTNIQGGERVTVMIKNHAATITGNISSPSARLVDVTDQTDAITTLEILIASKVDTDVFTAEQGRINDLVADNVTIRQQLSTNSAFIGQLQAEDVIIEDKLIAANAAIDQLETNKLDAEVAVATYATISELEATNADIYNLEVTYGNFVTLTTQELEAIKADIKDLDANSVTVDYLKGNYATIIELDVERGRITNLEAEVGDVNTLIFGSATGNVIQTSFANAVIAQLGNAQIKSAMIESLSANKITAGDIITNNVRVMSEDGSLIISDETIQISDDTRVRVQIGKDTASDYSINIWDADGKLMFSEGGITDSAIKQAIIRDDMVSDMANISAHKLNIDSLFEEINGSSKTIKSSKIYLDDKAQTLDVAFTEMITQLDDTDDRVTSQGTQLSILQGQIDNKIWLQDISDANGDISETQYSLLSQRLDSVDIVVAKHTADISSVTDQVSELEVDLIGFKSTVSDTYVTKDEFDSIDINGTNMLRNTRNPVDKSYWQQGYIILDEELNENVFFITRSASNEVTIGTNRVKVTPGETYTVSALLKRTSNVSSIDFWFLTRSEGSTNDFDYAQGQQGFIPTPDTWKRYTWTFTIPANAYEGYFRIDHNGSTDGEDSTIYYTMVKMEKGNAATDWTPAPADMVTKSEVSATETKIEQTAERVSQIATETANNTSSIASLDLTTKSLTTKVSQTDKNLSELTIGGRNLVIGSSAYRKDTPLSNTTSLVDGIKVSNAMYMPVEIGETYTIQCCTDGIWGNHATDGSGTGQTHMFLYLMTADQTVGQYVNAHALQDDPSKGYTGRRSWTYTVPNNGTKYTQIMFRFDIHSDGTTPYTVSWWDIKAERGTKATDWTPAPEDMATAKDIELAQNTADEALSTATIAETLMQQLSDSISMLVTDGNGTSLMKQTESGWTFSTAEFQAAIARAAENLDTLNTELGDTNSTVDVLKQAVDDLGEIAEYVSIGTYEDEPCIELGEGDSEFKLRITNTRILFMEGSSVIAHFTNQSLHIKKAVIEEELQQGGFVWKVRSNGNMGLVWKGVNS